VTKLLLREDMGKRYKQRHLWLAEAVNMALSDNKSR